VELLNKEVINVADANGLSRITEIVRYIPSLVKVENVYNINNDRQRKLEYHLKVLLKALLIEFEKMKEKTGVTPEVDEEVIKMIHDEIGDSVSVDDILKVFQVNQRIVEVPKIVEKIVERIIEVPTIVPV
jgi:DNA-binding transcriptional ArsR family regulator